MWPGNATWHHLDKITIDLASGPLPVRRQAFTRIICNFRTLRNKFHWILHSKCRIMILCDLLSLNKMHLEISSLEWCPFCSELKVWKGFTWRILAFVWIGFVYDIYIDISHCDNIMSDLNMNFINLKTKRNMTPIFIFWESFDKFMYRSYTSCAQCIIQLTSSRLRNCSYQVQFDPFWHTDVMRRKEPGQHCF